jgi:hypothetical protein
MYQIYEVGLRHIHIQSESVSNPWNNRKMTAQFFLYLRSVNPYFLGKHGGLFVMLW